MSEIEIFRITPTKGKHYYAILAQKRVWDNNIPNSWGGKGEHRYYAVEAHKRYMGVFVSSWNSGSGDGRTYTEIYMKNDKRIELNYDYNGMTCLQETDKAPESEDSTVVPIDAQIASSRY
jgi:hypothetical protein